MAEQIMIEAVARAVAEVTTIALQTMVEIQAQRSPNAAGPKLGSPTLKHPTFDWNAPDKYVELKTFILEVRNVLSTYNALEADKIAIEKKLVREKRAPLPRDINGK